MDIEFIFRGGLATQHKLPAVEATQSLEGLTRALSLVSHYAVTGKVRHRYPFDENFKLELLAFESGSFRSKLNLIISKPAVTATCTLLGVAVVQGPIGNFAYDLLKYTFNSAIGIEAEANTQSLKELEKKRPGDLDALREAIVPATKRAHTIIGNGADSVNIIGSGNNVVIYNQNSKDYLDDDDLDPLPDIKLVSVGMLNVNTRNVRVFDFEYGRLVSAYVSRDCESRTLSNLGLSLSRYARDREKSKLYIKYVAKRDIDGNAIRYYIQDAWFEGEPPPKPQ